MAVKEKYKKFEDLKEYKIDRDEFRKIFDVLVLEYEDKVFPEYEGTNFKTWQNEEEFYILHKSSGTLVNWYKFGHVGRTNTCNKDLTLEEYRTFVEMLIHEIENDGVTEYDYIYEDDGEDES